MATLRTSFNFSYRIASCYTDALFYIKVLIARAAETTEGLVFLHHRLLASNARGFLGDEQFKQLSVVKWHHLNTNFHKAPPP